MQNIKNFAILSFSGKILFQAVSISSFQDDLSKLASNVSQLSLRNDERQKVVSSSGHIFLKNMAGACIIGVCCTKSFPERHAFGCAQAIFKQLSLNKSNITEQLLDRKRKTILAKLEEFDDPRSFDKVFMAQAKLEDIKLQLNKDIARLVENQGSLEGLQERAENMKNNAELFKNQSKDLQSIMYWRNMRINIFICMLVLGIVGIVIFGIVSRFTPAASGST